MTARSEAIKDIMAELKKEHRCFLAFRRDLNAPIRDIVRSFSKQQDKVKQQ